MTTTEQYDLYAELEKLTGEQVVRIFTDYHGMQLIDDGFKESLVNDGYIQEDVK